MNDKEQLASTKAQVIQHFWQAFCQFAQQPGLAQPDAWSFGMGTKMADELAELVVAGKKTATTSAVVPGESVVAVGQYDIVLDGKEQPVAVIQNVVSEVMPYNQVSAEHAYHEGEGDRTLAYWQSVHEPFWRTELKDYPEDFSETMLVSCEVFRLLATEKTLKPYMEAN